MNGLTAQPTSPRRLAHPRPDDRPVALGYLRTWLNNAPDLVARRSALLSRFAESMAWSLSDVFVEDEPNRPLLAFSSLIVSGRLMRPVAVLIADPADLGSMPEAAAALRRRIEDELGVPLLVAREPALRRVRQRR